MKHSGVGILVVCLVLAFEIGLLLGLVLMAPPFEQGINFVLDVTVALILGRLNCDLIPDVLNDHKKAP